MRRFNPQSLGHVKNVAKSMNELFREYGFDLGLSKTRELLSKLYGYADWHDLQKNASPSAPFGVPGCTDDELAQITAGRRAVLASAGIPVPVGKAVITKAGPFSRPAYGEQEYTWETGVNGLPQMRAPTGTLLRIIEGRNFAEEHRLAETTAGNRFALRSPQVPREHITPDKGFTAVYEFTHETGVVAQVHSCAAETVEHLKRQVIRQLREGQRDKRERGQRERKTFKRVSNSGKASRDRIGTSGTILFCGEEHDVLSRTWIADGLFAIRILSQELLNVHSSWIARLPESLRADVEEGSWTPFLRYGEGCIFPVCFPDTFTMLEVAQATTMLLTSYPETYRVAVLGQQLSDVALTRARRGFATQKTWYALDRVLRTEPSGAMTVLAIRTGIGGPAGYEGGDEKRYVFSISADRANVVSSKLVIDEDLDTCFGEYRLALVPSDQASVPES